ncbi:hypothetical protein MMYC01_202444 [Madurella mycetomatis]|uniref:Uncharacterized protein n=1 Tax=Madurella mycetomatis TaxID=100816 RepID=A0A175WA43_9PEZI|nr:hypothetical protein MMYC01_202444 [Madurella mycetomatis]
MELSSPLTTLASISTPESYYTARGSPSNAADDTTITSPGEDEEEEASLKLGYRDTIQLPHELKSHCQIHLEEQLYSAAIQILTGLLADGNAVPYPTYLTHAQKQKQQQQQQQQQQRQQQQQQPQPQPPPAPLPPKPARVPPPSQLALLGTLVIHPLFTSRPPEKGNLHVAASALAYLRGLVSVVGAVNANLRGAFAFDTNTTRRSNSRNRGAVGDGGRAWRGRAGNRLDGGAGGWDVGLSSSGDDDSDSVGGQFARDQILFRRAPDFWAVLGWAFRCAAEYPQRWRHWRVWLEYVVWVLEADFDERVERDQQGTAGWGGGKRSTPYPMLKGSLLVGYLEDLRRARKNVSKEVMRALFAFSDGDPAPDRALFREVFERETVAAKSTPKRKRAEMVVDLENDQFGDYLEGDEFGSEEGDMPATPSAPRQRKKSGRQPKAEAPPAFCLTDDIAETVPFRLRMFRLLSAASFYLPDVFMPVDELYETFTDHVRGLPLPMFQLFVESRAQNLPEDVQVSLLRVTIENMLSKHPDPADVDPEHEAGYGVTVPMMQKCFLPFAANRVTAEDNAKLSVALESLLWFIYSQVNVEYSEDLRSAVEMGIKAREDRIRRRGAGALKGDASDKAAREVLARSARNLKTLMGIMATTAG